MGGVMNIITTQRNKMEEYEIELLNMSQEDMERIANSEDEE